MLLLLRGKISKVQAIHRQGYKKKNLKRHYDTDTEVFEE